jgi:hypothetical protein
LERAGFSLIFGVLEEIEGQGSTRNLLLLPGEKDHPRTENHEENSSAEVHIFGGNDLAHHRAQETAQSRSQYQGGGGPEEHRPLGMAFGSEAESGQLGFVPQFSQENGTEGCENDSPIHDFSSPKMIETDMDEQRIRS